MKKVYLVSLVIVMSIAMSACGDNKKQQDTSRNVVVNEVKEEVEETKEEAKVEEKEDIKKTEPESNKRTGYEELDSILEKIETIFDEGKNETSTLMKSAYEDIEDYSDYNKKHDKITKAYEENYDNAKKMYKEVELQIIEYGKAVANSQISNEYREWDNALTVLYRVWDDKTDEYYKNFDDEYTSLYKKLDDVITEAYDKLDYSKASDMWSQMYEENTDNWSKMYELMSDNWSLFYEEQSALWQGFYEDNKDVEALIEKATKEHNKEQDTTSEEEEPEEADESDKSISTEDEESSLETQNDTNGVTPDFKKAMDEYEAFYDEYCDFMKKYIAADSDNMLGMLSDYTKMLTKCQEMNESFEKIDTSNMSKADQQYYIDVNARIQKKLLEVMN